MLIQSAVVTPFGTSEYVGTTPIAADFSGPNVVVSGVSGYFILVLGYLLVASNAVEIAFETETGAVISGPYQVGQYGGNIVAPTGIGQFGCKTGEDLILDLSGPIPVGGHLIYALIRGGL